ncbi:MAG: hypothetical protein WD851_14975 [Pirellulales bacterium]
MPRILFTLALLSLVLMGAALVIGLAIGDLYESPGDDTLHLTTVHRLTGLAAALAVVFVQCIVVTYFIGTGRWCKEVVETYQLDPDLIRESTMLKRRAFPWAVLGMLAVVGVAALGAAADPATGRAGTQSWANVHLVAALGGIAFIGWTYCLAWNYIAANQTLIQRVLRQVAQVREQRGLSE